jgi:hypothetical protein
LALELEILLLLGFAVPGPVGTYVCSVRTFF